MNRFDSTFKRCRSQGKAAFVAYVTAGDPDYGKSLKVVDELVRAGIDILELGIPFSDPLADGEANQLAAERAISSGINSQMVLQEACEIRKKNPELPIVLFTYMNPIAYSGNFREFCRKAVKAGVDAILPLDLPPEEDATLRKTINESGLLTVGLIAPNTPKNRIPLLCKNASAFIYYVSREGVTGEGKSFSADFAKSIDEIKRHTRLPVVVGFGISTPEHVKAAASTGVDGIVVGSAIVRKVEALSKNKEKLAGIGKFVKAMCKAAASNNK